VTKGQKWALLGAAALLLLLYYDWTKQQAAAAAPTASSSPPAPAPGPTQAQVTAGTVYPTAAPFVMTPSDYGHSAPTPIAQPLQTIM
jgi:hypothetical protein